MIGPPPPLFFHDGKPRAGPSDGFSEGASACLKRVAIWGFFHREEVWEEQRSRFECQNIPSLEQKQLPLVASRCAQLDPCSDRLFIFQPFVGV